MLAFCSCSSSLNVPNVVTKIDSNAKVSFGGSEYECKISRLTDGVVSIMLQSPDDISGLTFKFSDGKYTVSYGELMCRSDSVLFPQSSFPRLIMDILSVAAVSENLMYQSCENGLYTFSGSSDSGKFSIVTDSSGIITQIIQESTNLNVAITA